MTNKKTQKTKPAQRKRKTAPKTPKRPVRYTEAIGKEILEKLEEGQSLRRICKPEDMPTEGAVRKWARDADHPFSTHYEKARLVGYFAMLDEMLEIADDGTNDTYEDGQGRTITNHDVIARSRLRIDTRKWTLAKMLPKVFGDKLQLGGDGEKPIVIEITKFNREDDDD